MTDEILAHISAPATRQTDNLYRSLVAAYHDFEPYKPSRDEDQPYNTQLRSSGALPKASPTTRDDSSDVLNTSVIASSKDSFGSFPSHLSSEDHVNSNTQGAIQVDGDSTEYGSIPTSSRLGRLERLHQDWRQKTTPKTSFARSFQSARQTPQNQGDDDADTAFIEDTQLGLQALQSQLEVDGSKFSEDDPESVTESEDYTGIFQAEDLDDAQLSAGDDHAEIPSQCAPMKRNIDVTVLMHSTLPSLAELSAAEPPINSERSESSSAVIINLEHSSHRTTLPAESFDFSNLEIDVFPPPPEISISQPRKLPSQSTPYLASLKAQYPKRFKLIVKKYNPRADDRGYWIVDCAHWSVNIQFEFWSEMQALVLSGKLGWGATLHRMSDSPHKLGQVRLYCWAEVIEAMWLQLWKSSGGRFAGTPAKWCDADGVAIMEAVYWHK